MHLKTQVLKSTQQRKPNESVFCQLEEGTKRLKLLSSTVKRVFVVGGCDNSLSLNVKMVKGLSKFSFSMCIDIHA